SVEPGEVLPVLVRLHTGDPIGVAPVSHRRPVGEEGRGRGTPLLCARAGSDERHETDHQCEDGRERYDSPHPRSPFLATSSHNGHPRLQNAAKTATAAWRRGRKRRLSAT